MFIPHLLIALVSGLLIVWIVFIAFGTKGPWGSFLWFFMVVFLFAWAGGVWLTPFGPTLRGIGWLPIIFMGILAALLLTAASPRTSRKRVAAQEKAETDAERTAVVDAIFWVLIICLVGFGVTHYVM
jgi:hypothetical protein